MSHSKDDDVRPRAPQSADPADVDELLSESLKAQSEQDFTWKEPERRPRWWERAETDAAQPSAAVSPRAASTVATPSRSSTDSRGGVRIGSVVFGLVALVLAAWVIVSVVFDVSIEPLVVGLIVCTLAGLALVAAGLRPKSGRRI